MADLPVVSESADFTEHCLGTEQLLDGRFLKVLRDTVSLPSGEQSFREYCVHPGAVMVIPILDDSDPANPLLLMERQYRYPVRRHLLEFPAGKLDPNESLLLCAQRELSEETGYAAQQWSHLGCIHPCIAYSTEQIDIWLARGLVAGERHLDQDEFLSVHAVSFSDLQDFFVRGELTDAKTIAGYMWLSQYLAGKLTPQWVSATA